MAGVCTQMILRVECGDMWFATEEDTRLCVRISHIGSLWHVCMCVCVCVRTCVCTPQEDRENYHLNLASPEDEKQSKVQI